LISSIDDIASEGRYLALQIFVKHDSYSDAKDIVETMMTNKMKLTMLGITQKEQTKTTLIFEKLYFGHLLRREYGKW
jgi:hypothetical protein